MKTGRTPKGRGEPAKAGRGSKPGEKQHLLDTAQIFESLVKLSERRAQEEKLTARRQKYEMKLNPEQHKTGRRSKGKGGIGQGSQP